MMRIGVTGQNGFVGYHVLQWLKLQPEVYTIIPFERNFFNDHLKMQEFVSSCDAIIHLAAMNRGDEQIIYDTNVSLVEKIIDAMEKVGVTPQILFSSSTQETRGNKYGDSKKKGAELFDAWATKNNAAFSHFVIPNVFGPFGRPFYNSVTGTFCYQLTHNESPKIIIDAEMTLIYVGDLVKEFEEHLGDTQSSIVYPQPVTQITVTKLLQKLELFKETYFKQGIIPKLSTKFDVDLFNTFRCYANDVMPIPATIHSDSRGIFVEVMKEFTGGQTAFSTTVPGVTRGNHYHLRKIERFCVIKGKANIRTRRIGTDEVHEYKVSGDDPVFVDMPIYYTHNITNTGDDELLTLFWINELFNPEDSDTYYEEV